MSTYLIVGGGKGIAEAAGKRLLAAGHTVQYASRSENELSELGGQWQSYSTGEEDQIELPETLDGIVYCAGSIRLKPFHRISEDEFLEDFQTNALGAARLIQHSLSSLKAGAGGSVVLFSSIAAHQGLSFHASIAMAKAALEGLSLSLAAELAPKIRVNTIAPSLTETPLATSLIDSEVKKQNAISRHPLKRIGKAEEVAALVEYLLGENASFVSGQVFRVDGGLSSLRV